jgi:hypothetical protein
MNAGGRRVLIIPAESGNDAELYRQLMPSLVQLQCDVQRPPPSTNLIELVEKNAFDLIVIGFPIDQPSLPALLKSIRWRESACRRSAVLLVSDGVARRRADAYLNRGASRVVLDDATDWELESVIGELLQVEPRVPLNLPVKLDLPLAGKVERVVAQLDNVSISGMLIRGQWDVEIGAPVKFEFTPPGERDPMRGTAEVVRPTTREREGLVGFAVRFVRFEQQGEVALDRFIQQRLLQPLGSVSRNQAIHDTAVRSARSG